MGIDYSRSFSKGKRTVYAVHRRVPDPLGRYGAWQGFHGDTFDTKEDAAAFARNYRKSHPDHQVRVKATDRHIY